MSFNASKCKVQTVTRKLNPVNFDYHLGDKILAPVKKGKTLGIVITNYLTWDDHHILTVVSKADKMLGLLRRICPLVKDTKIRHSLYLSLVSVTGIMRLKSGLLHIFRSNIRLKTSKEKRQDEYYSKGKGMQEKYKDRLIALDLLPLCYDRERTNLMFFYKASHGNIDRHFQLCFLCQ